MTYTDKDIEQLATSYGKEKEEVEHDLKHGTIEVFDDVTELAFEIFTGDDDGNMEDAEIAFDKLLNMTVTQLPGDESDSILKRLVLNEGGIELENGRWAFTYHN